MDKNTTLGVNNIAQATYSIPKTKDNLFLELKYQSAKGQSLKDIKFNSVADNISYMLSYMHKF